MLHTLQVDAELRDAQGNTLLHALCQMEGDGDEPGRRGRDGSREEEPRLQKIGRRAGGSGPALLHALITSRSHLHLFATNSDKLTALGAAAHASQCAALLLEATQRAMRQAIVNIVFCKREGRAYIAHAKVHALL